MESPKTARGDAQMATAASADATNHRDLLAEVVDDDDGRSSSLSEIDDDRLDSENMENMNFSPQKLASEVDSEAETERIDDSPHRMHNKASIVLSTTTTTYGASPSKLVQSTTYDDLEDDDNESEPSPSKPALAAKSNGVIDQSAEENEEQESPEKVNGRKRKRVGSLGDISELPIEDGPSRKRRGSLPLGRASNEHAVDVPPRHAVTEPTPRTSAAVDDETPAAEDDQETETVASLAKAKKDKKAASPKKGKRTRSTRNDTERESNPPETNGNGVTEEPPAEDEDNAEAVEEADEAEAPSKLEECEFSSPGGQDVNSDTNCKSAMRKTNAMDTLTSLEQHFATLRDR